MASAFEVYCDSDCCDAEIDVNSFVLPLTKCSHTLCSSCISKLVCFADEPRIICPVNLCKKEVMLSDVKSGVSSRVYEAYLKRIQNVKISAKLVDETTFTLDPSSENSGWSQIHLHVKKLMEKDGLDFEEANGMIDLQPVLQTLLETACLICLENIEPGDGVIIKNCLHIFCRECLAGVINHSEESEVSCPYRDGEYKCEERLKPAEVLRLTDTKTYNLHYNDLSLKEIESIFTHCMSPNCHYFCELAEGTVGFECPICNQFNCYHCKVQHTGENCVLYQERLRAEAARIQQLKDDDANRVLQQQNAQRSEAEIQRQLQYNLYKRCPRCGNVVEKNGGCDHMTCKCGYEYYWSNGSRYSSSRY